MSFFKTGMRCSAPRVTQFCHYNPRRVYKAPDDLEQDRVSDGTCELVGSQKISDPKVNTFASRECRVYQAIVPVANLVLKRVVFSSM